MAIDVYEEPGGLVRIEVGGRLQKEEFDRAQGALEAAIRRAGRIKILVVLDGFEGWESGRDWGDVSFAMQHDADIDRMAIVGDEKWRDDLLAFTMQPLRPMPLEFFDSSRSAEARAWLG